MINGAALPELHPARRKLAGQDAGAIFDRLMQAQTRLKNGENGLEKPVSCSSSLIAKIAELKPKDEATLGRLLGERRAERFAGAFLEVLAEA